MVAIDTMIHDCQAMAQDAFVAAHPDPVILVEDLDGDAEAEDMDTQIPVLNVSLERGASPTLEPVDLQAARRRSVERLRVLVIPRRDGTRALQIGRSSDNDLVLHDPSISSHHAVLHVNDGVIEIEDLGSKNGTQVDGRQLPAGERAVMERSRVITLGSMRCRYCEPDVLYEVLHLLALGGR